eukprot:871313-Pelagomonas_calceolata.AAC.6
MVGTDAAWPHPPSSLTAPAAKATTSAATAAIAGPSPGASDRAPKECASTARSTAICRKASTMIMCRGAKKDECAKCTR